MGSSSSKASCLQEIERLTNELRKANNDVAAYRKLVAANKSGTPGYINAKKRVEGAKGRVSDIKGRIAVVKARMKTLK